MLKFAQRRAAQNVAFDMTPMIDCTFQLVVFFLLTLNFSTEEQSELIHLPQSELAKPPERSVDNSVVLQITARGQVLYNGDFLAPGALLAPLNREKELIETQKNQSVANATVILRADQDAKTGVVQEVIQLCQKVGFEKFVLRAKSDLREKPS
ncbi:MAG: biopolymer transporter ExbD [Pirellulales bacterium]|nr:biopolymer transporter ExbD [Pirellulales bacterium]